MCTLLSLRESSYESSNSNTLMRILFNFSKVMCRNWLEAFLQMKWKQFWKFWAEMKKVLEMARVFWKLKTLLEPSQTFPETFTGTHECHIRKTKKLVFALFLLSACTPTKKCFHIKQAQNMKKVLRTSQKHQYKTKQKTPRHHFVRLDEGIFMVFVACFDVRWLSRYILSTNEKILLLAKKVVFCAKANAKNPSKSRTFTRRKWHVRDFSDAQHIFAVVCAYYFVMNCFSVNINRIFIFETCMTIYSMSALTWYTWIFCTSRNDKVIHKKPDFHKMHTVF